MGLLTRGSAPPLRRGVVSEAHLLLKGERDRQQLKTFTRWWASELPANNQLPKAGLVDGVSESVLPIILLETLTHEPIKHTPAKSLQGNRVKKVENHVAFLNRVKAIGIELVNIGAEDLVDGNPTLILGLTWKLICHFSDGMLSDGSSGADLLAWVKKNAGASAPSAGTWVEAFQDGTALCALLHSYDPGCGVELTALRPGNSQKNLELAFTVAHDKFGVPRLLDSSDFGGADAPVDVRSLQTYVLKLRQALRAHPEQAHAETEQRVVALEARAAALADWATGAAATLAEQRAVADAKRAAAATPAERQEAMKAADEWHEQLERGFRGAEKPPFLAERASVLDAAAAALRGLFATGFDHGVEMIASGAAASAARAQRLRAAQASLEGAWAGLEAAEAAYEEVLFAMLTYKKTDTMLAHAESEMANLAAWAAAQQAALAAADGALAADSLARTKAASDGLGGWAAAVGAMAARLAAVVAALDEVQARRVAEEREPARTPASEEGLAGLRRAWSGMQEAAVALRRGVGLALEAQREHVAALDASWAATAKGIGSHLPADAVLGGPDGGCALM